MKNVEIYNNEARCGTWLISKGFKREHTEILKLIRKYENRFLRLENGCQLIVKKTKKEKGGGGGGTIKEYMLNYNQVLFLSSLMRVSKEALNFRECLITQANVAKAIELLNSMDIDDILVRYVYAMQDDQNRVKIGISNDPNRRVKEIQAANGGNISLIMVRETINERYQDETALHNKCNKHLIHSEWFVSEATSLLQLTN